MRQRDPPIGILAGGGSLPLEIATRLAARGVPCFLLLIEGEADADFSAFPAQPVNWGAIGAMIAQFKQAGCRQILFAGRVRRPDLTRIRPDLGFFLALPTVLRLIAAGGDDRVLRGVIGYFERHGLEVVGPADVAAELVAGEGPLGAARPDAQDAADAAMGFAIVRALGPLDIGQGAVVAEGRLEALEGAEGTDAMLRRTASRRRLETRGAGGVLVKRSKPGQELRVDLPAIGPETIARASEAQLGGIAIEAGRTLLIDGAEIIRRADAAGLFVLGRVSEAQSSGVATDAGRGGRPAIEGARRLDRRALRDGRKGVAVLRALAPFAASRGAVVVRGHVLAVETGEGVPALLARAARLRQWGDRRWRRREGVAVLAGVEDVTVESIDAATAAGLRALLLVDARGGIDPELARRASLGGLSLCYVSPGASGEAGDVA